MSEDYFLMPRDINVVVNSNSSKKKFFLSHHLNKLVANSLDILITEGKNVDRVKVIQNINLQDYQIRKKNFNKFKNLQSRISNIFNSNLRSDILPNKSPLIMGIVNITSDSFYDGGKYNSTSSALKHAYKLLQDGADIIDLGAESTKPGSKPVNTEIEKKKLLPVIRDLIKNGVFISCDTRNASTMEAVIDEGVQLINDVSGLNYDKGTLNVLKNSNCSYVLMHTQGIPSNMQLNPKYKNAPFDIYRFFKDKIMTLQNSGVNLSRIIIDPGIGFGKKDAHNFDILKYLPIFLDLGVPILIGLSRKSFIGRYLGNINADRLSYTLMLGLDSYLKGVRILRVHDVKETLKYLELYDKIS